MAMVLADMEHSTQASGIYCGIWMSCTQVGVLDFTPEAGRDIAVLSLLMIAKPYRNQGIGSSVVHALLSYLRATHGTTVLESGVQVNNAAGIAFWRKHGFEIDATARKLDDGTTVYSMYKRISTEALRQP
jgi:ribosomal protein S18 acetylase RimI-like enzyme